MGATIECWSDKTRHPLPAFSSFVLTTETSAKVYGAVITFYESYPESLLQEEHKHVLGVLRADGRRALGERSLHTVKAICLLSRWPLFDAFRDFLVFIYRLTVSPIKHKVPIERHIAHFMHRVPLPSPERPRVQFQMSPMHSTVLHMPQVTPIPMSGASFLSLLDDLGAENTLTLITLALLEYKILVHSLRRSEITRVAEALISLLFPFKWQCTYVPLCPIEMAYVLEAPTPFIVGADSRYFDICEPPPDVVCINLDTNVITQVSEKKITWKMLPKKASKHAKSILLSLFNEIKQLNLRIKDDDSGYMAINPDVTMSKRHMQIEILIQETVLKLMAVVMNGYRAHLLPLTEAPNAGTTDPNSLFNMHDFVHQQDRSGQRFFSMLTCTQLFADFIETRSFASMVGSFGSEGAGKAASLVFFDECIDRLKGEYIDDVILIEADDMLSSERTIIVMAPDEKELSSDDEYSYTTFPQLQNKLFELPGARLSNRNLEVNRTETTSTKKRRRSGSFMIGRRTKQEMKVSQKQAKLCCKNARMWSRLLLSHAYSVWFGCLLDFSRQYHSKASILRTGLDIMHLLHHAGCFPLPDEMCYRVLMHLCCLYNKPVLAVKVFQFIRDSGTILSAVTYGLYNKALLECTWPASDRDGYVLWKKLKNVFRATVFLRRAIQLSNENEHLGRSSSKGDSNSSWLTERANHFSTFPRTSSSVPKLKTITDTHSLPDTVTTTAVTEGVKSQFLGQEVVLTPDGKDFMTKKIKPDLKKMGMPDSCKEDDDLSTDTDLFVANVGNESLGLKAIENSPEPIVPSKSQSGSIVKPSINDIENHNGDFLNSSNDVNNSLSNGYEQKKFQRSTSVKFVIERMDITNLALDPLSPMQEASAMCHLGSRTPSRTETHTPSSGFGETAFAPNGSKDEIPSKEFSSLEDAPLPKDGNICDSKSSTPDDSFTKHSRAGLLRRSFSFAPGSSVLDSGSKLNSLLKTTTIGVASKAKKFAASLAKDINETVQTNLAYYTPEKFKGSLGSLPELSQNHLNEDARLKRRDNDLGGSQSSLCSYNEKHNMRSSLKVDDGSSCSSMNMCRPTLAMSSNSINSYHKTPIELDVTITSCSKCPRCDCLVYDEEIMAGWMADESNLNTHCPFCNTLFVPQLDILIRDYRSGIKNQTSLEEPHSNAVDLDNFQRDEICNMPPAGISMPDGRVACVEEQACISLEPISVPYLSPLVLRKELESLLENEGIDILGETDFIDLHPIVYWNFIWYFRRLNLQSSLYDLVLGSKLVKAVQGFHCEPNTDNRKNFERVVVRTMWDNVRIHDDMVKPPLYQAFLRDSTSGCQTYPPGFLESIKQSVIADDVRTPLLSLLNQFSTSCGSRHVRRSAYREILFFVITALGKDCIDIDAYDNAYKEVFDELSLEELEMTRKCDRPPTDYIRACRNLFGELDLC